MNGRWPAGKGKAVATLVSVALSCVGKEDRDERSIEETGKRSDKRGARDARNAQ